MSVMIARRLARTSFTVEAFASLDGQGAPSYGTAATIAAHIVEENKLVPGPAGSELRTTLTLYVAPDQDPQPAEQDRLTVSSVTYIVLEARPVKKFGGSIDHTRLRCREE